MILEYSDIQESFHVNNGTYKPNSNGYVTISERISQDNAAYFIEYLDELYPIERPFSIEIKRIFKKWEANNG